MINKKKFLQQIKFSKKVRTCMLAFVLISIATLTIAYAALSTTLKISGTAEFQEVSWGFKVEEQTDVDYCIERDWNGRVEGNSIVAGTAQILKKPTISGTALNNFEVSFTKPEDKVYLIYRITNTGTIPAKLDSIITSEPTYTSNTNNQDDINLVKREFWWDVSSYELFEENGKWIDGNHIVPNAIICPGASFSIEIEASYGMFAVSVPSSNVTISNLNTKFNFVAANNNLCNGSTPVKPNQAPPA